MRTLAFLIRLSLTALGLTAACSVHAQGNGNREVDVMVGKVVDERSRPIEGARVEHVIPIGTTGEGRTDVGTTDAKGTFRVRIPKRPAAQARSQPIEYLRFHSAGRVSAQLYVSSWYWMMTGIRQGAVHDLGTLRLPDGEPIPCRIRKPDGRPLAGAKVMAHSPLSTSASYYTTTVQYLSEATTDAKGAATVLGRGEDALDIQVSAAGFLDHAAPAHPPGMPLVVAMQASGAVTGRVVDHEGKPVECLIAVRSEVSTSRQGMFSIGHYNTRTAPDGTFEVHIANPGRFRLTATPLDSSAYALGLNSVTSELLDGPKRGIVIRLAKPRGVEGGVALLVVDKKTGKPIPAFRAAVFWQDPAHLQDSIIDYQFTLMARQSKAAGEMLLEPPPPGGQLKGAVVVKAKGYAAEVYKLLKWKEDEPARVKMELEPEIAFEGVVTDKQTGEPIADAAVWTQRTAKKGKGAVISFGPRRMPGAIVTDAKGHFRIPHLRPGDYDVHVSHAEHPDGKPKSVHLKDATKLKLELDSGCSVSGKLEARQIRPGWKLTLSKSSRAHNPFASLTQNPGDRATTVAADGTFAFRGVQKGKYTAHLVVPQAHRQDARIPIPGKVDVKGDTLDLKLDVSEAVPGRIRGKLEVTGIAPPRGRIVISVEPAKKDPNLAFTSQLSGMNGPACTLRRDKSFDLELAPGKYHLTAIDIATRTILLRTEEAFVVNPGDTTAAPLSLELALVRVRLKPEEEGGQLAAGKLSVKIEWGAPQQNANFLAAMGAIHGLPVYEGSGEVLLYLPNREVQLTVSSAAQMLAKTMNQAQLLATVNNKNTLAEKVFTPKLGVINRVDLTVKPPPDIDK